MKKTLIYFSPSNETAKVNNYYLDKLSSCEVYNITDFLTRVNFNFNIDIDFLILSFPIYSQDIPQEVKEFVNKIKGKYAVINVTYGGISYGNGLYKAGNILKSNGFKIIGASILSAKHSYSNIDYQINLNTLDAIIEKIESSSFNEINIGKQSKNILASIAPNFRSKLSVKAPNVNIDKCNRCTICQLRCPVKAIDDNLKINNKCIRCMSCVILCKNQARVIKRKVFLNLYLKLYLYKNIQNRIII